MTNFLHLFNRLLPFRRFLSKFPLVQILADLNTALNVGAGCVQFSKPHKETTYVLDTFQQLLDIIREVIELRRLGKRELTGLRLLARLRGLRKS